MTARELQKELDEKLRIRQQIKDWDKLARKLDRERTRRRELGLEDWADLSWYI